jgi:hypothetical protein
VKYTEVNLSKQGRPAIFPVKDMASGATAMPPGSIPGLSVTNVYGTTARNTNYTANSYAVILVDTSTGPVTVTLPPAASSRGKYYYIKKIDNSANPVRIESGELVDAESTHTLTLQYQYVMVVCDSTTWHIIGGVWVKMEEILQSGMAELAQLLEQIRQETVQAKLHLASISDEPISEEDTDVS